MDLSQSSQTYQSRSSKASTQMCLYKYGTELPEDLSLKQYYNFTSKDDSENRSRLYSSTSFTAADFETELPLDLSDATTCIPSLQDNEWQQARYRQVNNQSLGRGMPIDLRKNVIWNSSQFRFTSNTTYSRSTHSGDRLWTDNPSTQVSNESEHEYEVNHSFLHPKARALSTDSNSWLSADSNWNKCELMQSDNDITPQQQRPVASYPPEYCSFTEENFSSLSASASGNMTGRSESTISTKKPIPAHKSYACDICGKSYKQVRDYRAHLATHKDGTTYKCDVCFCELNLASDYVRHLTEHQQAELNNCTLCDRYFRDKCTLKTHLRTHTGEKPYGCEHCGKRFAQTGTCARHKKLHR